jgi:hypothetical protein
MITIPLSTEDLTKVRLAPSPLWETLGKARAAGAAWHRSLGAGGRYVRGWPLP